MTEDLEKAIFLHQKKDYIKSEKIYRRILKKEPSNPRINYLLGSLYLQIKQYKQAEDFLKKSLNYDDKNCATINNLGLALMEQNKILDAIETFKLAINIDPGDYHCLNNLGVAYKKNGNFSLAIENYSAAILLNQNFPLAYNNRGLLYYYQNKIFESEKDFLRAIDLDENYEEAFINLGFLEYNRNNYKRAIEFFDRAILVNKNSAKSYLAKAEIFLKLKNFTHSLSNYEAAKKINTKDNSIYDQLSFLALFLSKWNDLMFFKKKIKKLLNDNFAFNPLVLISLSGNIKDEQKNTSIIIKNLSLTNKSYLEIKQRDKINIAYFSADFRNHVMGYLMEELVNFHNKNNFNLFAFYLHNIEDDTTKRIKKKFDGFFSCFSKNNQEIKKLANDNKIDIAIDLQGYTYCNRVNLFRERIAPIQINYLGYQGSVGFPNMDYIISDKYAIPENLFSSYYEKVIQLPVFYIPHYKHFHQTDPEYIRKDFNLPNNGIILCCFNNTYKIHPEIFSIWLKILNKNPKTYIWMLDLNEDLKNYIYDLLKKNNLEKERIIFRKKLNIQEHLKTYQLADLFLDTYPYGAHTTAVESMFRGTPVICIEGTTLASRVGSSLCNFLDEKSLITKDLFQYEKIIQFYIDNPQELKKIKKNIANKIKNILNTKELVSKIEDGFYQVIDNHRNNNIPKNFKII